MQTLGPYYIGKVSFTSLRGWILDSGLSEADTILLHPKNMEAVLEEYRELYHEAMPTPYFLLGVLLDDSIEVRVPEDRVLALVGDDRSGRPEYIK